jgi:hypothetical protein
MLFWWRAAVFQLLMHRKQGIYKIRGAATASIDIIRRYFHIMPTGTPNFRVKRTHPSHAGPSFWNSWRVQLPEKQLLPIRKLHGPISGTRCIITLTTKLDDSRYLQKAGNICSVNVLGFWIALRRPCEMCKVLGNLVSKVVKKHCTSQTLFHYLRK